MEFLQENWLILINTLVTLCGIAVGSIALIKARKSERRSIENEKKIQTITQNTVKAAGFVDCSYLDNCKAENIGNRITK